MARIPFELNDEIKDAFVERIIQYGNSSPFAVRPTLSQVLRSFVSLVVTMDNSQLGELLQVASKSEEILAEYLDMIRSGMESGLVSKEFPIINTEFDDTYGILRERKLKRITEEEFKEKMNGMEVSLLVKQHMRKQTEKMMDRFKDKTMYQVGQSQDQRFSGNENSVLDEIARKNRKENLENEIEKE